MGVKGTSISPTRPGAGLTKEGVKESPGMETDQSDEETGAYESEGETQAWDTYAYSNDDTETISAPTTPGGASTASSVDVTIAPMAISRRSSMVGVKPAVSVVGIPSSVPNSTTSSSSTGRTRRDTWFSVNAGSVEEKRRKEQVWLLGPSVENPALSSKSINHAGGAWPFRMCVHSSLEAYKTGSTVRSLAVDSVSKKGTYHIMETHFVALMNELHLVEHTFVLVFLSISGREALHDRLQAWSDQVVVASCLPYFMPGPV